MKLILDEWIVREVIDTLYMARTTFLGITGLDSPQEIEKKSANETAIPRRISKAIDLIQQSEQSPLPKNLEEAAMNYIAPIENEDGLKVINFSGQDIKDAFIAGAKWQKEQDDKEQADLFTIVALDAAQRAKEQMLKEAVEGEVCGRVFDHINVCFADGICKFLEPKNISHIPADVSKYKVGDKVKIIIVKE